MPERILVGIPVYNDYDYLDMLLQSIRWYTVFDEPFDLVVCDDGSTSERLGSPDKPDSIRGVCAKYGVILIENDTNQGIPITWNHLSQALGAESEIVVLLNDDTLMVPNWLRCLVYFLDENKDNPHIGTACLQPLHVPRTTPQGIKARFREILPDLGHTVFRFDDIVTGREQCHEWNPVPYFQERQGHGHGLAMAMCPTGCSFGFRREVFNMVGGFDENILSFHEESTFGTVCAQHGRGALAFCYPRPYHVISGTFMESPELRQSERMLASRAYYRGKFGVPPEIADDKYFDWVNAQLMPQIPRTPMKYLSPDYDQEPERHTRAFGGDPLTLPKLIVREEKYPS